MEEIEKLKVALTHARLFALTKGVTMRKFAAICKISPTQLLEWYRPEITTPPDLTRHAATDWDEQKEQLAREIMAEREHRDRIIRECR